MRVLLELKNYNDELGNRVVINDSPSVLGKKVRIEFHGKNNLVIIGKGAKLSSLTIRFGSDNSVFEIGKCKASLWAVLGCDSIISISDGFTATKQAYLSVAEGGKIIIDEDCMVASDVQLRADDAHPIFDLSTGKRINVSGSIYVGKHVWLAERVILLKGSKVGNGSCIGLASVVRTTIPENAIAVGNPAKVVRENIIWKRNHLAFSKPGYKPDINSLS